MNNNIKMKKITKAIAAIMLAVTVVFAAGCGNMNGKGKSSGSEDKKKTDLSGSVGGHEFVDLGLSSGTLWATCNVGANAPEEYGDYFAWGETTTKAVYDWNTYSHCKGDGDLLTKYNVESDFGYQGFADGRTTLQPTDDAATANWGSEWCMPTKTQWEELLNNTNYTDVVRNGVKGMLFTSSNGQSLFLPAAGERIEDRLHAAGIYGEYWSNTLHATNRPQPYLAWKFGIDLYISPYSAGISTNSRYAGFSVRPVRSSH